MRYGARGVGRGRGGAAHRRVRAPSRTRRHARARSRTRRSTRTRRSGSAVHAGHGLTVRNVGPVAAHRGDRGVQHRPLHREPRRVLRHGGGGARYARGDGRGTYGAAPRCALTGRAARPSFVCSLPVGDRMTASDRGIGLLHSSRPSEYIERLDQAAHVRRSRGSERRSSAAMRAPCAAARRCPGRLASPIWPARSSAWPARSAIAPWAGRLPRAPPSWPRWTICSLLVRAVRDVEPRRGPPRAGAHRRTRPPGAGPGGAVTPPPPPRRTTPRSPARTSSPPRPPISRRARAARRRPRGTRAASPRSPTACARCAAWRPQGHPPLPEVVDAVERARQGTRAGAAHPVTRRAPSRSLFARRRRGAPARHRATFASRAPGPVPGAPEELAFHNAMAALPDEGRNADRIVPIAELFYDDAGPTS